MESATYSEARVEYQKQMSSKLIVPLLSFFRKIRADLWQESQQSILSRFQRKVAEIPKWNQDVVAEETSRLIEASRCDYLEELMTALFIAHTKVMASVRVSKKNKKLTITVPKLDHFLHRVFTETAKSFWKAPFLFQEELPAIERQKNLLQAEAIIEEAIYAAVRDMLPIKKILQEYIAEPGSDGEEAPEEVSAEKEPELVAPPSPPAPAPAPAPPSPPSVIDVPPSPPSPAASPPSKPTLVITDSSDIKNIPISEKVVNEVTKEEPPTPANIKIDTEPAVQFSEMVSVFDETKSSVGEMRSIENPLDRQKDEDESDTELLHIGQELGSIDTGDAEDLDNPGSGAFDDFETLE
jgi:hypothetical protein